MSGAFLTDYFFFLHLPKTGGGTMCEIIDDNKSILNSRKVGDHTHTYDLIPLKLRNESFFFVRNPWDYYVSQYEYGKQANNSEFRFHARNLDFKKFINVLLNANYKQFVDIKCVGYQTSFLLNYSYPKTYLTSPEMNYMNPIGSEVMVYKLEDGMTNIVENLNNRYNIKMIYDGKRRLHATKRKPYQEYYDDETINLVAQYEKLIIDKYNYEF